MGVVLKHTFKNIWSKPFRTLMLLICIIMASFVAALSFDMTNSLKNILRDAFGSAYGTSNVLIADSHGIDESTFEGVENTSYDYTLVSFKNSHICVRDDEMYAFYNQKSLKISAADVSSLVRMNLLAKDVAINDQECVISKKLAEEMGYNRGDKITIYGDNEVPVEYTVKEILPYKGVLDSGLCALVSEDGMKHLSYNNKVSYSMAYIHVDNEKELASFCDTLSANNPYAEVENLVSGKTITSQVSQISAIFYFLFLVCLLLVVFVTISLSERIMVERMTTVGTLRSLGVSVRATTLIVLLENALYGLIGGTIGVTLYALTRDPIFNKVFTLNSGSDIQMEMNLGSVSWIAMIGVVAATILIECICPIKELLRAVKTPIRDIIFDNKDTEFKYGRKSLIVSLILAAVGIPCLVLGRTIMAESVLVLLAGWLLPIVALFLGYPHLLRAVCKLLAAFFEKRSKPIAQLACVEASTKKASVGNSRLLVMSVTICLVFLSLILSYKALVDPKAAICDVVVTGLQEESARYDFIKDLDSVSDMELLYATFTNDTVIGTERIEEYKEACRNGTTSAFEFDLNNVIGANGPLKMNVEFQDIPEHVGDEEIVITSKIAKKFGVKVGDSIEILFKARSVIPVRQTLKISAIYNSTYFDGSNDSLLVSENTYKKIYFDTPYRAYVKCSDPDTVIKQISRYASSIIDEVETEATHEEKVANSNAGLSTIIYMLIVMGVALTLIAVISNQAVGFEGRKRECAVLISTSMSRGKLKKMFFLENLISAAVAVVTSLILAFLIKGDTLNLVRLMSLEFPEVSEYPTLLAFAAVTLAIFTLTVLGPIRHLRKMKTAEQLKYE